MTKRIISFFLLLCAISLNGIAATLPAVQELSRKHICAKDGMILLDFAGPKAQLVWKNGNTTFYCDPREAFDIWFDIIQQKRIKYFYVQHMDNLEWKIYKDKWIDVHNAWFVIDSKKLGAMGLSYIPFKEKIIAQNFQKKYLGTVYQFNDISLAVLKNSTEMMRENMDKFMPM